MSAYYAERGRRPRNCWDCDGVHACKCDAVTIRAAKRAVKATWRERILEEVLEPPLEYYAELAADRLAIQRLFPEDETWDDFVRSLAEGGK